MSLQTLTFDGTMNDETVVLSSNSTEMSTSPVNLGFVRVLPNRDQSNIDTGDVLGRTITAPFPLSNESQVFHATIALTHPDRQSCCNMWTDAIETVTEKRLLRPRQNLSQPPKQAQHHRIIDDIVGGNPKRRKRRRCMKARHGLNTRSCCWTFLVVVISMVVCFMFDSARLKLNTVSVITVVEASSFSNTYNVYNYDRTVMQFTPDGQLLQLGYASSAADNSPPLVVVECYDDDSNDGFVDVDSNNDDGVNAHGCGESKNDGSVFECNSPESMRKLIGRKKNHNCLIIVTMPRHDPTQSRNSRQSRPVSRSRPQQRVIELDDSMNTAMSPAVSEGTPNSITNLSRNSCCVCLSGVLADSLALLKETLEDSYDDFIIHEPISWWKLVQSLATKCHVNSLGGGIRPYGSCFVVCGYKHDYTTDVHRRSISKVGEEREAMVHQRTSSFVYQTDPSGGIIVHSNEQFVASRKQTNHRQVLSQVRCIVGGSSTLQRQLRKCIDEELELLNVQGQHKQTQEGEEDDVQVEDSPDTLSPSVPHVPSMAERIATIGRVLFEERNKSGGSSSDDDGRRKVHDDKVDDDDDDKYSDSILSSLQLEVVVISPTLGSHRLSDEQIQRVEQMIVSQLKAKKKKERTNYV